MRNILERTQNIASDLKIPQFDILLSKGSSLSLSAQQNRLDTYKVTSSNIIGIRVIKDQKIGISYSEDFSDDSLKTMVRSAEISSQFSGVDEFQNITTAKNEIIDTNTKTFQNDNTDIKEKIDLTLKLEREIRKIIDDIPELGDFFGFRTPKNVLSPDPKGPTPVGPAGLHLALPA